MKNLTMLSLMSGKRTNERRISYGLQLFADDPSDPGTDGGEDLEDVDDDPADEDDPKNKEKKYTDEDVNRMFERKFAEWQKKQEKAQRKQDEAERLKNMSAQEREQQKNEDLQNKINELLRRESLSKMEKTARGILAEKGITVRDELIRMLISEDADETKESVDSFADAFQEAVDAAVKERLKGKTPKAGGTAGKITKEQILKVKDRAERQRLINEHLDLFQS